jgi:hypothetical protein
VFGGIGKYLASEDNVLLKAAVKVIKFLDEMRAS